jgi:hypothetical protein
MKKFENKTREAISRLDYEEYRNDINILEKKLHKLRDELTEKEKRLLQNIGYKPIKLDEFTILAPVGISIEQLYVSLQQMNPPNDEDELVRYFVTEDDLNEVRESKEYLNIVKKRQQKLDDINDIYKDFWNKEVKNITDSDEESIIFMLAGLDRDIGARKLSDITGISKYTCKRYSIEEDTVIKLDR